MLGLKYKRAGKSAPIAKNSQPKKYHCFACASDRYPQPGMNVHSKLAAIKLSVHSTNNTEMILFTFISKLISFCVVDQRAVGQ